MMKKLFLAAQLLLGLGLTSCGQEDVLLTHQQSTRAERITLSVDFAPEAESNPRSMTVTSGGSGLQATRDDGSFGFRYMLYRFARKVNAKAVFSQEATEPVTLVFYHGGKAYPVESQISLKNVNGHYRGDIEATLPAALSGVTRSDIEVAGVLGATSVDATTGKITVTAPPAIVEGEEMQTMPMYFPKTALSASSTHLAGLRFKFLGVLVVMPVVVKAEWTEHRSSVRVEDQVFTPEVFTFGPNRFTESQVEVDLSQGGAPTLTRTSSSTYVHPLRKTEVISGDGSKTHILYVFPVRLDTYAGMQPTLYGRYYPKIGARQYDQSRAKEFVIPRYPTTVEGIPQGSRSIVYDMTIAFYNGDSGIGTFKGDDQKTDYSVFSGRDVDPNMPGRGWN
ncbi:MAG: hypothetical protein HXN23_09400 [Porphyromonas sp.]|uniref:hypothetical protein n=1 Tax=Porphyromonas sp. TaxID=1924944 RepID=UPI001CB34F0D|nr:hypothetical protein [Porphyromonas sp.]MBF1406430.1 hypothetical protein [Porphyromonas sp.]